MEIRKNILLIIPTFAEEGGAQKMVYELGKLLSEKHNVYECSFNAYRERHVFQNNNKVLSLNAIVPNGYLKKLLAYPLNGYRLHQMKKKYKIDITISNLWAADLVNVLSSGNDKIISIGHINIVGNAQNLLLYRLRHVISLFYNRFDKIIAVSKPLRDELKKVFNLKADKITFINNFIDFPKSGFTSNKSSRVKRLITIGRLNSVKNQETLIKIFCEVKKVYSAVQLVIIGDGPLKEQLIEFAKGLGNTVSFIVDDKSDVVFTGFNPNPYPVLFSSNYFVFPSRSEGLPLVLAEAMYAGLPIITSDCPTGPHMIMQGKGDFKPRRYKIEETSYGYLMPIPDLQNQSSIEKWKSVIIDLLLNETKSRKMAENAKKRSLDFSKDQIKENWFSLIQSL